MKNGGLCIRREVNGMQKHIAVWIICLGLAIGFPYRSRAFEYDVWKSGMEMEEVLKLAEINDIPVTCMEFDKPLVRGQHHFRTDLLRKAKKSRNLCYKQNLSGSSALITLHFTPMSKQLSYVGIYWTSSGPAQQKEIILSLSEKYGEPLKYSPQKDIFQSRPGIRLEDNISETQFFVPDRLNIIAVQYIKKGKNELRIIYQDTSQSKQEQAESKAFEQYIKTRYRQQDDSRM